MDPKEKFIVKSYNTKELANHYGVTPKVIRRWLTPLKPELGTRIGNYYSAEQVKIIIERLGKPES
jgi:transposase